MASPIHKFLFSPPPSPPSYPVDYPPRVNSPALTSLASLLPPDLNLLPRPSLDGDVLKVPSPRTPQTGRFTLDSTFPTLPSRLAREDAFRIVVQDVSAPTTSLVEKETLPNIPTTSATSVSLSIPRPLVRLFFLVTLLVSSACILIFVPSARLPSLHSASVSRRLALSSEGKAYVDLMDPVTSWEESRDRGYIPPQIYSDRIKRSLTDQTRIPAPPKTNRPSAQPLPPTHELLALQSYILQSTYNVLPPTLDVSLPLDANFVLGYKASEEALSELEAERSEDIVIWYGGGKTHQQPHELLGLLKAIHGPDRHPTLIKLHGRPDKDRLMQIFDRLELPFENGVIVMIGNRPFKADLEEIEEMRASGKLELLLNSIGWSERRGQKSRGWKPRLATVKRREKTEVEHALEQINK